jgi:hypothetical protein
MVDTNVNGVGNLSFRWGNDDGHLINHTATEFTETVSDILTLHRAGDIVSEAKLSKVAKSIVTVVNLRDGTEVLGAHLSSNGLYVQSGIEMDGTPIRITYRSTGVDYTIHAGDYTVVPTMLLVYNNGEKIDEFIIKCGQNDYNEALGCNAPIDIATTIHRDAVDIAGMTASFKSTDGQTTYFTREIGADGFVEMHAGDLSQGEYIIEISDISVTIGLKVNGG